MAKAPKPPPPNSFEAAAQEAQEQNPEPNLGQGGVAADEVLDPDTQRAEALARLERNHSSGLAGLSLKNTYLILESRGDFTVDNRRVRGHMEDYSFVMDTPYNLNSDDQAGRRVHESYSRVATYEVESTYSYMIPKYEALNSLPDALWTGRVRTPMLPNIYALNMMRKVLMVEPNIFDWLQSLLLRGSRFRELLTRIYAMHAPIQDGRWDQDDLSRASNWVDNEMFLLAWHKDFLKDGSFYFQDFAEKASSLQRGNPFWLVESSPDYEKGSDAGKDLAEQSIHDLCSMNKLVILNENNIMEMKELTENVEIFPMYNTVRFATDVSTNLAEALGEADLVSFMIPFIASRIDVYGRYVSPELEGTIAHTVDNHLFDTYSAQVTENYDFYTVVQEDRGDGRPQSREVSSQQSRVNEDVTVPIFDLWRFTQYLGSEVYGGSLWDKLHAGYNHRQLLDITTKPELLDQNLVWRRGSALEQMITTNTLRSTIQAIIAEKAPRVNHNYNETLFYEIVKTPAKRNAEGGSAYRNDTQRIFVPNFSSLEIAEYVDTQVHYGEAYEYQVYAWEAVMGIDAGETRRRGGSRSHKLKVMRVPYVPGSVSSRAPLVTVLDRPPMPPRTVVYPYVGVSDKLLLSLGAQRGEAFLKPDILGASGDHSQEFVDSFDQEHQAAFGRPSDLVGYTDLWDASTRKQKKVVDGFEHLLFRSDESLADRFEIYRTTDKPTKIEDFTNKLHKIVPTHMATNAAHVDDIEPNVKYYYAVRTVDPHNQVSNLSHIYEVELVMDELGTFYMTQRVLDLEEEAFYEDSLSKVKKSFRKRMQILPTIKHKIIEEDTYAEDEDYCNLPKADVVLGLDPGEEGEKLWGKKFKIRISSKDSGRKMDLNVAFTHRHNLSGNACEE